MQHVETHHAKLNEVRSALIFSPTHSDGCKIKLHCDQKAEEKAERKKKMTKKTKPKLKSKMTQKLLF